MTILLFKRKIKKLFKTPSVTKAIIREMYISYATFLLLLVWASWDVWKGITH